MDSASFKKSQLGTGRSRGRSEAAGRAEGAWAQREGSCRRLQGVPSSVMGRGLAERPPLLGSVLQVGAGCNGRVQERRVVVGVDGGAVQAAGARLTRPCQESSASTWR